MTRIGMKRESGANWMAKDGIWMTVPPQFSNLRGDVWWEAGLHIHEVFECIPSLSLAKRLAFAVYNGSGVALTTVKQDHCLVGERGVMLTVL